MIIECGPDDDKKCFTIAVDDNVSVALTLSGGMDTALLTYLVALELLETNRNPNDYIQWIFTIPKKDGAELYPDNIIRWINQKLGITLPSKTILKIPKLHSTYHGLQVWNSMLYAMDKYNPDKIYMGDQRAAPDDANISEPRPVRSKTIDGPMPNKILMPFNHLYKYHTVDVFYKLGLEELFELTHSCTQMKTSRCNRCYHCLERKWGFDQINKVDTGKI
jgi:hypothetical protein